MLDALRHGLRFLAVARAMARHRALFWVDELGQAPAGVKLLIRTATRFAPKKKGLPRGEGERLAEALRSLGPAYIKLGQMLSTRPDLIGIGVAEGLRHLQDRLPPFSQEQARAIVEEDLGRPLAESFAAFESEALAAASIAQVHKARTPDGRTVAVKLLRPGIEARFRRDLEAFLWVAEFAERHIPKARRLRPIAVVQTITESTSHEMDLRMEAAAASEIRDNMEGEPGYRVPAVDWERTTRRMLTMEWIEAIALSDRAALKAGGFDLEALAATVVRAFLLQTMRDGFFHADLHQGNLFVEADGMVVALDFGIVGRLDKPTRRYLAEILYGFLNKDYQRVADWHFSAGYVPPDRSRAAFAQAMRAIAEPIFGRPVKEISAGRLLAQLFATTEAFGMQTQPQLLLLQRSMVMVEGMALHLDPKANMWALADPVIKDYIKTEFSPEIVVADALHEAAATLTEVPALVRRTAAVLDNLERDGVQLAPESAERLAKHRRSGRAAAALGGFILGAALASAAALIVG